MVPGRKSDPRSWGDSRRRPEGPPTGAIPPGPGGGSEGSGAIMILRRCFLLFAVACGHGCQTVPPQALSALSLSMFECDVSPPVGHPLTGGSRDPVLSIATPLLARGLVLAEGRNRYVVCAIDWCRIQNGAYDLFRAKLAAAVGTIPSQVALQCTHAHEAPLADSGAQHLLDQSPSPPVHLDLAFLERVTDRLAESARAALVRGRPFTHIGYGKGKVEQVASNSRVFMPDGKLVERPSVTSSPAIQAQPEGKIDPWIRTITLFDGESPLVRLHYYACHPENTFTHGKVSSDIFGPLRERLQREDGVPHLYFAGCGGDVGMGKYHVTPAEDCSIGAIDRISAGIREAVRSTQRAPVVGIDWKAVEVRLVSRADTESEAALRERIGDAARPARERIRAALALSWIERMKAKPAIDVSRLRLGPVSIVHLPGEPFVEYQLYAQGLTTDFVAVAGYGDGGPGYICTDQGVAEGGYQPSASRVGPPTEARLKEAIALALR